MWRFLPRRAQWPERPPGARRRRALQRSGWSFIPSASYAGAPRMPNWRSWQQTPAFRRCRAAELWRRRRSQEADRTGHDSFRRHGLGCVAPQLLGRLGMQSQVSLVANDRLALVDNPIDRPSGATGTCSLVRLSPPVRRGISSRDPSERSCRRKGGRRLVDLPVAARGQAGNRSGAGGACAVLAG